MNGLLNYGYAVLRAGVARAVMAAGFHPSLGLMHSNRANPTALVYDLMEPFGPTVDREVADPFCRGERVRSEDAKAALARIMVIDLPTSLGLNPVMVCADRLAHSLHGLSRPRPIADLPRRRFRSDV